MQVGLNVGTTMLYHNTNFYDTPLRNQYELNHDIIEKHYGQNYTWQDFTKDMGLVKHYAQPKFGFSAHVTYRDWPVFGAVEASSSPSSYTKMEYGATIGMGQYFTLDDESWMIGVHGGYKFVYDQGFGTSTLINSISDTKMRELLVTFFNPTNPLRSTRGNLFTLRAGIAKCFGNNYPLQVGLEFYGELDLIDPSVRQARMTNVGMNAYARFKMF
jgi:hypothetical protein